MPYAQILFVPCVINSARWEATDFRTGLRGRTGALVHIQTTISTTLLRLLLARVAAASHHGELTVLQRQ